MPVQSPWNALSAFQVFGDHVPMAGFSLVVRITADPATIDELIAGRASSQAPLDPELATMMIRAGLGLAASPAVSFIYATSEEAVAVLRGEAVGEVGQSLEVHDHLLSAWAARMALLSGLSVPVHGHVYELPDVQVERKAVGSAIDSHEESTMLRSAKRLGAQLRGRGQAFHESMLETLEEQSSLLAEHGVNTDALPSWWWRGVAARAQQAGDPDSVELWTDLPTTEEVVGLIG